MLFHDPILSLQTDRHDLFSSAKPMERPHIHGKFLYRGQSKLWIRGVTYGTFRPNIEGDQFPDASIVADDFARMVKHGFNSLRTYTVPPRWVLDLAQEHGLLILVGLPWEQHITFLDDPHRVASIEERVRHSIRGCAEHPAILGYAVGNEIPSPIVRWHGQKPVQDFLESLYHIVKTEDPEGLVTYVNYPTTEYLQLPFLDFVCFNVYLESQDTLSPYLARLQNIANERPLLLAEIGLDSMRKGQETQAEVLDWQIRTVGASGGAGAFIFAWTDEWYRGGFEIEDWDFGLTDRARQAKPALESVEQAFKEFPIRSHFEWPRISVVICSYNGARTIRDCLDALQCLDYPNYEVIVVNDGSTDRTEAIAKEYPFRVISTSNQGLSNARNTGLKAASGDIVAYTDDDAYPDPHWLSYLAHMFLTTTNAAVGGPNLPPKDDGWIAECVAHAPGGPIHVLLNDQLAEHIPGCNMAFRKRCLEAINGFDPQYRAAGDDVDVCWRLQEQGWTIGFHAAAQVWHHRRNSIRTYWKQQRGYGRAEALLEQKWPQKYNVVGHVSWEGRLYGKGSSSTGLGKTARVYQGVWGSAPFQLMYQADPSVAACIFSMPEWNVAIAALACISVLGVFWPPLLFAIPLFLFAAGMTTILALRRARQCHFEVPMTSVHKVRSQLVTAGLHILQPIARLIGRLSSGLTPWRTQVTLKFLLPCTRIFTAWSETWEGLPDRLEKLEGRILEQRISASRGGNYDQWDLHIQSGICGGCRMQMVIEEHGAQKQLIRCRTWPIFSQVTLATIAMLGLLGAWALADQSWTVGSMLVTSASLLGWRANQEYSSAALAIQEALVTTVEPHILEDIEAEQEKSLFSEPVAALD